MLFLEKVLGPVNTRLKDLVLKFVIFQDNLSSYTTDDVKEFFTEKMDRFCEPRFIPPLMTFILQVIDRHIGNMYKYRVYLKFRSSIMMRIKNAQAANNNDLTTPVPKMSPKEKRILLTKIVADIHDEVTSGRMFYRFFIANRTWMHIYHLVKYANGNLPQDIDNVLEDSQVSLQHMKEYNYGENFGRDRLLPAIEKIRVEEERLREDVMAARELELARQETVCVELARYTDRADAIMEDVKSGIEVHSLPTCSFFTNFVEDCN